MNNIQQTKIYGNVQWYFFGKRRERWRRAVAGSDSCERYTSLVVSNTAGLFVRLGKVGGIGSDTQRTNKPPALVQPRN